MVQSHINTSNQLGDYKINTTKGRLNNEFGRWREAHQPEKHCSTIILPLFYHCFSNIDLRPEINIIFISTIDFFEFIDFFDFIDSTPNALYHNDHTWTFFELMNLFKERRAQRFWKFKFKSFWTTIITTQAIITTITHLFSNTFKEADTPTFVIQTQVLRILNIWGYSYRKSSVILSIT